MLEKHQQHFQNPARIGTSTLLHVYPAPSSLPHGRSSPLTSHICSIIKNFFWFATVFHRYPKYICPCLLPKAKHSRKKSIRHTARHSFSISVPAPYHFPQLADVPFFHRAVQSPPAFLQLRQHRLPALGLLFGRHTVCGRRSIISIIFPSVNHIVITDTEKRNVGEIL